MEDDLNKTKIKWKKNQSTKINLIGCDTIVNSPSWCSMWSSWVKWSKGAMMVEHVTHNVNVNVNLWKKNPETQQGDVSGIN